jgi:tRNA(fMet)-specific endonuclease VapC
MQETLLDTDTISLFLRSQPSVMTEAGNYLKFYQGFTFSIISRFEVLRGLKIKNAQIQIARFERISSISRVLNLNDAIILRASDIYADLYNYGQIIGDADILIAATALENNLPIITNNEKHFNRISGLQILNWNK